MPVRKVTIITDSIACLTEEHVQKYDIGIIPMNFFANGHLYKDGVDVTIAEAYELFRQDPASFKTSAASPGDCLQAYHEAYNKSKNILCITLSSRLSAIHGIVCKTGEQVAAELPDAKIEVLDSQTAAAAEGFVALAAVRAAYEGKDLPEVVEIAKKVRDEVNLIAFLDTVRYIYRSGRIPRSAAITGSVLKIRPAFNFSMGRPHFVGAVRNRERGMDKIISTVRRKVASAPVHVAVMHVYAQEEAERLKERVASEFNCVELWLTEFSPLMGYACGTGTLGLAFYAEL